MEEVIRAPAGKVLGVKWVRADREAEAGVVTGF